MPFVTSIHSQHCCAKKRRKVRGFPSKFDQLFSHFHYFEASRSHVWLCTVPAQLLLYFICRPSRFILRCCGLISFSNRPREEKKREKEPHTQKKDGRAAAAEGPFCSLPFSPFAESGGLHLRLLPAPPASALSRLGPPPPPRPPGGKFQTEGRLLTFPTKNSLVGRGENHFESAKQRWWETRRESYFCCRRRRRQTDGSRPVIQFLSLVFHQRCLLLVLASAQCHSPAFPHSPPLCHLIGKAREERYLPEAAVDRGGGGGGRRRVCMAEEEEARKREHCLLPPFYTNSRKEETGGGRGKKPEACFSVAGGVGLSHPPP